MMLTRPFRVSKDRASDPLVQTKKKSKSILPHRQHHVPLSSSDDLQDDVLVSQPKKAATPPPPPPMGFFGGGSTPSSRRASKTRRKSKKDADNHIGELAIRGPALALASGSNTAHRRSMLDVGKSNSPNSQPRSVNTRSSFLANPLAHPKRGSLLSFGNKNNQNNESKRSVVSSAASPETDVPSSNNSSENSDRRRRRMSFDEPLSGSSHHSGKGRLGKMKKQMSADQLDFGNDDDNAASRTAAAMSSYHNHAFAQKSLAAGPPTTTRRAGRRPTGTKLRGRSESPARFNVDDTSGSLSPGVPSQQQEKVTTPKRRKSKKLRNKNGLDGAINGSLSPKSPSVAGDSVFDWPETPTVSTVQSPQPFAKSTVGMHWASFDNPEVYRRKKELKRREEEAAAAGAKQQVEQEVSDDDSVPVVTWTRNPSTRPPRPKPAPPPKKAEEETPKPPAPRYTDDDTPMLYEYARNCRWDKVFEQLRRYPRDSQHVGKKDGTTALHLAVVSRSYPKMRDGGVDKHPPAPLELIQALVIACPEAAIIRCHIKKYTPLCYACLVADKHYDMDSAADMVKILLTYAPQSVYVFTDDGFSALDVHILSYSRFHKEKEEVYSGGRTSTVVLRTLLTEVPSLADARTYKNKIRGPIELLYRCNMNEFKDAADNNIASSAGEIRIIEKRRGGSVMSVLSDWWAWKWALALLKFACVPADKRHCTFSAVHAAARLVGCPTPILILAASTFPRQVMERDENSELLNLPLHEVCSWIGDAEIICGDPFVLRRKCSAIQVLVDEYPEATRLTNCYQETPLQLAVESCTPWSQGLEILVKACPEALEVPRLLRNSEDENAPQISVALDDDNMSVDSEMTGLNDVEHLEGMYPFMVAAFVARVPEHRQRPPSFLFGDQPAGDHKESLAKKELESVRAIYGLLRAEPRVLGLFIEECAESPLDGPYSSDDEEEDFTEETYRSDDGEEVSRDDTTEFDYQEEGGGILDTSLRNSKGSNDYEYSQSEDETSASESSVEETLLEEDEETAVEDDEDEEESEGDNDAEEDHDDAEEDHDDAEEDHDDAEEDHDDDDEDDD